MPCLTLTTAERRRGGFFSINIIESAHTYLIFLHCASSFLHSHHHLLLLLLLDGSDFRGRHASVRPSLEIDSCGGWLPNDTTVVQACQLQRTSM